MVGPPAPPRVSNPLILVPYIAYGPSRTPGFIPDCKKRSNPELLLVWLINKTKTKNNRNTAFWNLYYSVDKFSVLFIWGREKHLTVLRGLLSEPQEWSQSTEPQAPFGLAQNPKPKQRAKQNNPQTKKSPKQTKPQISSQDSALNYSAHVKIFNPWILRIYLKNLVGQKKSGKKKSGGSNPARLI